jgi:hypothetical protein
MKKLLLVLAIAGFVGSLVAMESQKAAAQTPNHKKCDTSTNCSAVPCYRILGSNPPVYRDSIVTNHQVCSDGGDGTCNNDTQIACTTNRTWTMINCTGTHTDTDGQLVLICAL